MQLMPPEDTAKFILPIRDLVKNSTDELSSKYKEIILTGQLNLHMIWWRTWVFIWFRFFKLNVLDILSSQTENFSSLNLKLDGLD
jgi:hypothetical protein